MKNIFLRRKASPTRGKRAGDTVEDVGAARPASQERRLTNYAGGEWISVDAAREHVEAAALEFGSRSARLFGFCLLLLAIAGGVRAYGARETGRYAAEMEGARVAMESGAKTVRERVERVRELNAVGNRAPVGVQAMLLATALKGAVAVRSAQYDVNPSRIRDSFEVGAGRSMDTVTHGGMWQIEGFALRDDADAVVRRAMAMSREVLGMNAFVSFSSGGSSGTRSDMMLTAVFWKEVHDAGR